MTTLSACWQRWARTFSWRAGTRCARFVSPLCKRPALTEPLPEHAALITTLILERPMCVDCIATKIDLEPATVSTYLARIARSVRVQELTDERCRNCGTIGVVYSIGRD
jgi:hypothetical protein